jgi:serine/threonine kinase 32
MNGSKTLNMKTGMQVVLDEQGHWSHLADRTATIPADSNDTKEPEGTKPSGMMGFFSRKKGRGHSPKPQERGVLGREGARHVIH